MRFCYWSIGNNEYAELLKFMLKSARNAGVQEDFLFWSDQEIDGAQTIEAPKFEKGKYLFKLEFMKEMHKYPYDYFVFLDADCYFVRKPENILRLVENSVVHLTLEGKFLDPTNKRTRWHGCKLIKLDRIMRELGVTTENIYNLNGGFFIIRREYLVLIYELCMKFYNHCKNLGYYFTMEAPMSYAMHVLCDNPDLHTIYNCNDIWITDWAKFLKKLPDGQPFRYKDWLRKEVVLTVNPAIVHLTNSRRLMR